MMGPLFFIDGLKDCLGEDEDMEREGVEFQCEMKRRLVEVQVRGLEDGTPLLASETCEDGAFLRVCHLKINFNEVWGEGFLRQYGHLIDKIWEDPAGTVTRRLQDPSQDEDG